jgi:hypothetical protein
MAEQSAHDVVNQTLSVGDLSPSDANVDNINRHATGRDSAATKTRKDNGYGQRSKQDDPMLPTESTGYPMTDEQARVCEAMPPSLFKVSCTLILFLSRTSPGAFNPVI